MPSIPGQCAPLRIIFAGTPDFAASSLAALLTSRHSVVAVYTQPDRPAGRGRKLSASPVKQLAIGHNIPVFQPESLKIPEHQEQLRSLQADLMVVAAYGLILPQTVLDTPRLGCVNVHASLLPRWRGAAPIQHALLAGDRETGITIMQMNAGLDTGDKLYSSRCEISPADTGSSLHDRLAALGAETLVTVLDNLPSFQERAVPQDNALASYAGKIEKADAGIDWHCSAEDIGRQIRAYNSWPVAFSQIGDSRVRIWQAIPLDATATAKPGTIVASSTAAVDVACGEGLLRLQEVQMPGAKKLSITAVMNAKGQVFRRGAQFDSASAGGGHKQ